MGIDANLKSDQTAEAPQVVEAAVSLDSDSESTKPEVLVQPESESNSDANTNSASGAQLGFGIMTRYPITSIATCAILGVCVGYGLSQWSPENPQSKKDVVRWVGLVGDMFLRALKCVVLPLVFASVSLATADMLGLGKARKVGFVTIGIYLLTTLLAACIGIISVSMFQGLFIVNIPEENTEPGRFEILCQPGTYMTQLTNGSIACAPYLGNSQDTDLVESQQFIINDLDGTFVKEGSSGITNDLSLSDTMYEGVFVKLIAENIVQEFYNANFGAVIICSLVFGVAIFKATAKLNRASVLTGLLRELEKALLVIINWILVFTPFAVFSLIANAVGQQDDLGETFTNVGFLMCAAFVGFGLHFVLVYMCLFFLITKSNPLKFLKFLLPAQMMAVATSSSVATLPMTLDCVIKSKQVPPHIARFVVPMGATLNMDGGGIYMCVAIIFLAITEGIEEQITAATYVLLIIIATIGSAGTAPVPSASLVIIITAYNTVFNTVGTPAAFSYILAIDWILDRCRTTLNVTGDAMVARMVTAIVVQDELDEIAEPSEILESSSSSTDAASVIDHA